MKPAFKKLRTKFLLLNLCLTLLLIGGLQLVIYNVVDQNVERTNRQRLGEVSQLEMRMQIGDVEVEWGVDGDDIALSYWSNTEGTEGINISTVALNYDRSFTIRIEDERMTRVSNLGYPEAFYDMAFALATQREGAFQLADRYWMYQTLYMDNFDTQITFLDVTDSQVLLDTLLRTFLMVGPLSLVTAFVISYYFASRSIKPIANMWEAQRRFVTDASHELKTPLSIVMANHDVIASNLEETVASQSEWLSYIKVGTDRMSKLINQMLLLSKSEDFSGITTLTEFSLSEVIQGLIHDFEVMAGRKGITLRKEIPESLEITTHKEVLSQIIEVLLENAVKYATDDGDIRIEAKREGKDVQVMVENSGGIEKKHLPYIFDRFYRVDESRNSETGGFGLGLSIAKRAAGQLKGDLEVESDGEKWTRFTLRLKG